MTHRAQALGDFNQGKTVIFVWQSSDANLKENVTKYLAVSDAGHCKGSKSCGFPPPKRAPAITSRLRRCETGRTQPYKR
ncbi:MAG: hypothetical protein KME26_27685 [Oscillatoria princeps RMCB-10]|nr:hypothetical protein [Oscillatoria princeps RMCB-10]